MGVGIEIISENIGPKKFISGLASYAYKFPLFSGNLSLGLKAGLYNFKYDWNEIEFKGNANIDYSQAQSQKSTFTADFGTYYSDQSSYLGISITHLNKGNFNPVDSIGAAKFSPHIFSSGGKAFKLNNSIILNPSFLVKYTQYAPSAIDITLNVLLKNTIWLGASMKINYGMAFLTQLKISEKFRIGYAYEMATNKLSTVVQGTHEIYVGYNMDIFKTNLPSPRFF